MLIPTYTAHFIHSFISYFDPYSYVLSQMEKATETMGNTKEKQFKSMMEAMTSSPHWYVESILNRS